jgi:hypothetical protein
VWSAAPPSFNVVMPLEQLQNHATYVDTATVKSGHVLTQTHVNPHHLRSWQLTISVTVEPQYQARRQSPH